MKATKPAPEFRELLQKAGLTLGALERRAGLAKNGAYRYKAGKRTPLLSTAIRIADALKADVGDVARALMRAHADYVETRDRRAATEAALDEALYRRAG